MAVAALRALAAQLGGQAALARKLHVTPTAVGLYLKGKRAPTGPVADLLVDLGVPRESLGLVPAPRDASPPPAPTTGGNVPKSREELERALDTLSRQVQEAAVDDDATWRDRAQLASSLTSTARALAKIAGQEELTESQILRSRAWRRVLGVLIESLTLFPEACAAAAEALQKFEAA